MKFIIVARVILKHYFYIAFLKILIRINILNNI